MNNDDSRPPPHPMIRQNSSQSSRQGKQQRRNPYPNIKASKPDPSRYKNYTFQHPVNASRYAVRTVDLSSRIAFDTRLPACSSSVSLRRMLDEMDRMRSGRYAGSSVGDDSGTVSTSGTDGGRRKRSDNPCRISPSPNHMALLERMHGLSPAQVDPAKPSGLLPRRRQEIRQLQWNVATSVDADPWFDMSYCDEREEGLSSLQKSMSGVFVTGDTAPKNQPRRPSLPGATAAGRSGANAKAQKPGRKRPKSPYGDGRYLPINPLEVTKSMIPDHSPVLTHVKHRLPSRTDVGFPNATKDEVSQKMAEIKREAEWEECSPRLVLLFSAFDLFLKGDSTDELHTSCTDEVEQWSGGKIPGLPFAGRDLVMSYKLASRYNECGKSGRATNEEGLITTRQYSTFAPPVDATFSASSLWRPRPFVDRPPGHQYILACPLDLKLEGGDTEPLFCTMTMYMLPKLSGGGARISEDFFFPAGECIHDGTRAGSFDEDDQQMSSWRRRKRRAIMSYCPLDVQPSDLYLVLQVFRIGRPNDALAHDAEPPGGVQPQRRGSKFKSSIFVEALRKTKSTSDSTEVESIDAPRLVAGPSDVHSAGAQYLTPVSFCVTPAFANGDTDKCGQTNSSTLYTLESLETEDVFIDKLRYLAHPLEPRKLQDRLIPTGGFADVFTSHLGHDFTRALLEDPPKCQDEFECSSLAPSLLTDVMGNGAISAEEPISGKRQRSNLRRLPPTQDAGYSSSFDVKEVLYMPPRCSPRKYDDESSICASTLLNLIYVYPRLIRLDAAKVKEMPDNSHYTLRVRVVEQEIQVADRSFDTRDQRNLRPLDSVYNPTSPAGPALVESYHTKLVRLDIGNAVDGKGTSGRTDIPLRDEVKIRLPDILDKRHFLQFTLLLVKNEAEVVAETEIPFIISSKESSSGGRVTTIIPNGLHRILMNEGVQVHIETRKVSSLHVSDSSVAMLLRDYPHAVEQQRIDGDSVISHTSDASSAALNSILAMASGQAVMQHFRVLLYATVLDFIDHKCPPFYFESLSGKPDDKSEFSRHRLVAWEKTDALSALVRGIIHILDKTRTSFQRDDILPSPRFLRLIKSFVDNFDEKSYGNRGQGEKSSLDTSSQEGSVNSTSVEAMGFDQDSFESFGAAGNANPVSPMRIPKYRVSSPRSQLELHPNPLTRRAFVATKSEQLRAELSLNDEDGDGYFDDDETVATFASRMDSGSAFPDILLESKSFADTHDDASIVVPKSKRSTGNGSTGFAARTPKAKRGSPKHQASFSISKRAEYVAHRVGTVAQLVMAPCVAPVVEVDQLTPTNSKEGFEIVQKGASVRCGLFFLKMCS